MSETGVLASSFGPAVTSSLTFVFAWGSASVKAVADSGLANVPVPALALALVLELGPVLALVLVPELGPGLAVAVAPVAAAPVAVAASGHVIYQSQEAEGYPAFPYLAVAVLAGRKLAEGWL